jgi:hypothetical protein
MQYELELTIDVVLFPEPIHARATLAPIGGVTVVALGRGVPSPLSSAAALIWANAASRFVSAFHATGLRTLDSAD